MDDDKKLMAGILAAVAAAAQGAGNPDFKSMSGDLLSQLNDRATAMGCTAAETTPGAAPQAQSPVVAAAEDDPTKKPGAPGAPGGAPMAAGAGVTLADVARVIREERAKEALLASAKDRPGVTPELLTLLAGKSLAEVREIVGVLPPAAVNAAAVRSAPMVAGAQVAAGVQAGEPAELTPDERADIKLLDRDLGVDPEQLAASRALAARGEAGVVSVKKIERVRLAARAAKKAR